MKKICSLLIMLLCVGVSASAFSKTKLYVNPGHGGYTSNDRQTSMPSVNGVKLPVGDNGYNKSNCFWESSGNTYRALGIKYFWTKRVNSNIKLSRSSNTQDGDLSLSTIASNSNSYGGYFMSLHTNAGNASANYMIVMYSATSSSNPSGERVSGSKKMATAAAKWHDAVNLTSETYDTPRAMTDRSFYGGSSLGVLRTNNAPGYLAESWFHDYRPEAFRMCSEGYNYFLAWQLMRAYLESPAYSGIQIYPIIVGDIRDLSKSCGYTSYTTRGRDKYLAINGATVTLKNVATGGTKTYTTDQFNNGFYTFYDCVYGATYEITVSKAGYKDVTKTITVGTTDTQHKLNFDLEEGTNSGITVSPTSVDFGEITAETTATKSVTVKGTDLSSTIAVSSSNTTEFAISATSLAKTGGTLTITYKPSAAGSHSTTITLTSGSHKKTLVVSGSAKNPPLTFTEVWNFSETSGKAPSTGANWASDKASIRNFAFGAGKLYVVSASEGKIYIVKAQTGEKLGELDMTGVAGGALNVVDVNYVDGKIIACNIATNAEATNTLKVYVWDNDKATPRVLLETTNIGGTVRLGDTFNLQGDLTNGALFFAEGKADTDTKVVSYTITNGVASTTPTVLTVTDDGTTGVQFGLSPRVIPEANGKFWCVGQNFYPTLFDPEGIMEASLNAEALNNECAGNTFKAFTFKGTTYGLATTYEPNSTSSERLRKGRIVLLDGSAGWAAASNVGEYPSAGLGTTRNTSMSSGVEVAVNGTAGVEMWVLVHNQGIAYYKHGTAPTYTYTDPTDPYVSASVSALSFNTTEGYDDAKSLTISGERLTGNINLALSGSNANQFKLSTTSIAQSSGKASATVTVTYDPTAIGSHTATLTITSDGAVAQSVALSGTCSANTVFNDNVTALEEVWNYSQVSNKTADWVSYGTQVNNDIAVANGKLYAVYRVDNSNNQIYVVDAYTGEKIGQLDVTPCTSGTHLISAVETIGGKVIACNLAAGASSVLDVYIWDNDNATPTKLLSTTEHGGGRAGDAMSVSGDLTNGKIWFAFGSKAYYYTITNGAVASTTPTEIALTKSGAAYDVTGNTAYSNIVAEADGSFWVISKENAATRFNAKGEYVEEISATLLGNKQGTDMKFFTLGSKKYAVATTYLNVSNTAISEGAFKLLNVTDGIASATAVGTYPSAGLGSTKNSSFRTSLCAEVTESDVYVWVNVPFQGVACYKFKHTTQVGVEDVVVAPEEVEMVVTCDGSTLSVAGVEASMIQVYSMSGACVASAFNSNEVCVDALNGFYVVVVKDAQGVVRTVKVAIC